MVMCGAAARDAPGLLGRLSAGAEFTCGCVARMLYSDQRCASVWPVQGVASVVREQRQRTDILGFDQIWGWRRPVRSLVAQFARVVAQGHRDRRLAAVAAAVHRCGSQLGTQLRTASPTDFSRARAPSTAGEARRRRRRRLAAA